MFRPPVNHAMRVLDRSFFHRTVPISAARVSSPKDLSRFRRQLEQTQEVLKVPIGRIGIPFIVSDPQPESESKCILLQPGIKHDDSSTWSKPLQELVTAEQVRIVPWNLRLNYDNWNYREIMEAIIPEQDESQLPVGFNTAGHIAHLNLREPYHPYKSIIAEVLLDKNPRIETVINKVDDVGEESEYRTFKYEVLAGRPDMQVEVSEEGCLYRFDYSKVYWNSKLHTEHKRLVALFNPGEAVCDVMAGIGPFAVPAGKKRVFVWANDLNPDGFAYLKDAITRNKVDQFVRPFNEDGRNFIRSAAQGLLNSNHTVTITPKLPRSAITIVKDGRKMYRVDENTFKEDQIYEQPRVFSHFVMNLPATAITFLPSFIGLYAGHETLFTPHTETPLPLIHVYCFSAKNDDNLEVKKQICKEISNQLGYGIMPDTPETEIWDIRDVAPTKRMFCATFRLPPEVAFRRV